MLPLHQRLDTIKAAHGVSRSQAMRMVLSERGMEPRADPWGAAFLPEAPGAPQQQQQQTQDDSCTLARSAAADALAPQPRGPAGGGSGILDVRGCPARVLGRTGAGLREFSFHCGLLETQGQQAVFHGVGLQPVCDLLNGLNSCILCYGQTGSGKTHTMFGAVAGDGAQPAARGGHGLVTRCAEQAFRAMEGRRQRLDASLCMSYVEVFGNDITDLLRDPAAQYHSSVAGQRHVLQGGAQVPLDSPADFARCLATGNARKRQAATRMNERSTRAHAIVMLHLSQRRVASAAAAVTSTLYLVDLGGSEKLSKSCAHEGAIPVGTSTLREYYSRRTRLQEAQNINWGLFALKRCISALQQQQEHQQEMRRGVRSYVAAGPPPYVPYQDSKLTQLLAPALNGGCRTAVVRRRSPPPRLTCHALNGGCLRR